MNNLRMAGTRRSMLGVTLLELMAVVMVIGILGMIALPSYRQYMMRAHRGEAKAFLLQIQTNQERFYLVNRTYGDIAALQAAGYLNNPPRSERGLYAVLLAGPNGVGAPNAVGYTATATAVAGAQIDMTADTRCVTFAIDAQGVRTATGTDAANCW